MSKMQSEALAKVMLSLRPRAWEAVHSGLSTSPLEVGAVDQWMVTVHAIAHFCHAQNYRLNRERFLSACGVE
jgi:hypothetical protein